MSTSNIISDFNKESRDPTRSLTNFEQAVRQAPNLIIMFGQVDVSWLQGRIKTAVKVVAEQFQHDNPSPLENIWILMLPKSGGESAIPKLPPIIKVNPLDNRHSEAIDPKVVAQLISTRNSGG
ncbi:MAG: hypothetical protein GY731_15630 [Gammaproteobacteria bacterium]|nr:hypothetical protein [Gammaproteobacteria bacterium]